MDIVSCHEPTNSLAIALPVTSFVLIANGDNAQLYQQMFGSDNLKQDLIGLVLLLSDSLVCFRYREVVARRKTSRRPNKG